MVSSAVFLFGHLIQLSLFKIAIFLIATLSHRYRKVFMESAHGGSFASVVSTIERSAGTGGTNEGSRFDSNTRNMDSILAAKHPPYPRPSLSLTAIAISWSDPR